jgi:ParB family transcriptional regulator, chromosome partitioning protein
MTDAAIPILDPTPSTDLREVPLARITIGPRLRPVRPERVATLTRDIDMNGLNAPLLVVAEGQGYRLVCGRARMYAVTALHWVRVPAIILPEGTPAAELRFREAMDNINRDDLTKLERAEHLAAIKADWDAMNPAARHGGDRRSARVRLVKDTENAEENQSPVFGLWSEVADKVGLGRTQFFLAIEIAKGLAPETTDRIRETWIADHQAALQAIAKVDPPTQARVCDALLSEPPAATSVADALLLAEGRALPKPDDKLYHRVTATWSRLPAKSRAVFLDQHKREVIAHAKAQGWVLE